jgi:hypothetical protein
VQVITIHYQFSEFYFAKNVLYFFDSNPLLRSISFCTSKPNFDNFLTVFFFKIQLQMIITRKIVKFLLIPFIELNGNRVFKIAYFFKKGRKWQASYIKLRVQLKTVNNHILLAHCKILNNFDISFGHASLIIL